MTDRKTTGGAHDSGGWIEVASTMLPGRLIGASEMEKRKAVAAGGLGKMAIRYRVITPEEQAERKRLDELEAVDDAVSEDKEKEDNDGNG